MVNDDCKNNPLRNLYLQKKMSDNEIQLRTESSPLLKTLPAQEIGGNHKDIENIVGDDRSCTDNAKEHSLVGDAVDTFQLAMPIFISRVSFVGVSSVCSSGTLSFGQVNLVPANESFDERRC